MSTEDQDEKVPKFMVICRAVAPWPDTTVAEAKIGSYEEPTEEDIARCKKNIEELFRNMIGGVAEGEDEELRIGVVVLPYCANDEEPAPDYDPELDGDLFGED